LIDETRLPLLLEAVRRIPKGSLLLHIRYSQEDPGQVIFPSDAARLVSEASPVPVYGVNEVVIGTGVVGGVVHSRERVGRRLAEMVLMTLAGRPARDIPPEPLALVPTFDWRQIERWGVDDALLPAGSIVHFRAPSSWQLYRWYIVGALVLVAVQTALITGLLVQRAKRRRAELDSRRNLALAADANRRQTMSALTSSIAHEVGQPLSAMIHNAQALRMMVTGGRATPDTIEEILTDIQTQGLQATQIIDRHRTMLRSRQLEMTPIDLHDVIAGSLGVVDYDMKARQIEVAVNVVPAACVITGDQVLLQQVLVNLMMNAMDAMAETRPDARRLIITVTVRAHDVEVSVRDNGRGLPSQFEGTLFTPFVTTKARGLGIGLIITRTILDAHGGTIDAWNNPEGGATFAFTLRRSDARRPHQDPEVA
jgi:signal transduction histidine kinase